MSAYEIMINDAQRAHIAKLLAADLAANPETYADNFDATGNVNELEFLPQMFAELKDDESNYCVIDGVRKHMLHGFCL